MANIEHFIPFVIRWETGTIRKAGESNEELFERARKRGYACDKDDRGGATQTGLTIATYRNWCARKKISEPTIDNLKNIPYQTWALVMKELFWDRWKADEIKNQSVAEMLVDWMWASGIKGIKKPQALLGVAVDGVVGVKTIAAVNAQPSRRFFDRLKQARYDFIDAIIRANPTQIKWRKGWINRINSIEYS